MFTSKYFDEVFKTELFNSKYQSLTLQLIIRSRWMRVSRSTRRRTSSTAALEGAHTSTWKWQNATIGNCNPQTKTSPLVWYLCSTYLEIQLRLRGGDLVISWLNFEISSSYFLFPFLPPLTDTLQVRKEPFITNRRYFSLLQDFTWTRYTISHDFIPKNAQTYWNMLDAANRIYMKRCITPPKNLFRFMSDIYCRMERRTNPTGTCHHTYCLQCIYIYTHAQIMPRNNI